MQKVNLFGAAALVMLIAADLPAQERTVPVQADSQLAGVTLSVDQSSVRFVGPEVAEAEAAVPLEAHITWCSNGKAIDVHVVQKTTEDIPSWKQRVRAAVTAMEDLFPPDKKTPTTGG